MHQKPVVIESKDKKWNEKKKEKRKIRNKKYASKPY
jgi:hypothetical protein